MIPRLILYVSLLLLVSCNHANKVVTNKNDLVDSISVSKISKSEIYASKIYTVVNGWGYDIYRNNKLFIHQPIIPAISGNKGFSTEHQAEIVAEFAIYLLNKGIMPPEISIENLDSLNVFK